MASFTSRLNSSQDLWTSLAASPNDSSNRRIFKSNTPKQNKQNFEKMPCGRGQGSFRGRNGFGSSGRGVFGPFGLFRRGGCGGACGRGNHIESASNPTYNPNHDPQLYTTGYVHEQKNEDSDFHFVNAGSEKHMVNTRNGSINGAYEPRKALFRKVFGHRGKDGQEQEQLNHGAYGRIEDSEPLAVLEARRSVARESNGALDAANVAEAEKELAPPRYSFAVRT
jgi:hypothetical protein